MVSKHAISDISTSNLVFCPGWYTTLLSPAHSAVQAHGGLSRNLWEESQPPGDKGGIKVQVQIASRDHFLKSIVTVGAK